MEPPVNPTDRNQHYLPTIAWYGECVLIGSSTGLSLIDPRNPEQHLHLAHITDRSINHVAVNEQTKTIAFNVAQEPVVFIVQSGGSVSSIRAERQAVTALAVSADGHLIAVASSDIQADYGLYYDTQIQIATTDGQLVSNFEPDTDIEIITDMFFGEEDMSVLTHNVWPGYFGDDIALWNVVTGSPRWNYNDLTSNLQTLSDSDPLAITTMTFQDDIILLGGLDGYYNDRNFYGYGVHLWDIRTRHRIKTIRVRSRFDESDIYSMPGLLMAFDSQRPILATSFGDSSVQFHEVETGKRIGEFTSEQEHVRQIVMNPDQDLLAILTDENVAIFDLEMMQIVASFSLLNII